jgi:hypothetical protein
MGYCKRCGRPIDDRYLFCYNCNRHATTYKDERGYQRFKDTDYPVHRWVAEKKIGRLLYPWEDTHHKDRDKLNNDLDNLSVLPHDLHFEIHEEDARRYGS